MKELKLNEIVILRNDFYKVINKKWSNGINKGSSPILKKLTNKELIKNMKGGLK